MGTLFVDKLDPQSGTSLEIGSSGDTVSVNTGATTNLAGNVTLGASGKTITVPSGCTITNSGTATGFGGNVTEYFHVYKSANQSISTGTFTTVTFDTEQWDSGSNFSSNTFTAPSTGYYYFYSQLPWEGAWTSNYTLNRFMKNGSPVSWGSVPQIDNNSIFNYRVLHLSSSDTVLVQTYQESGSSRNLRGSGEDECFFGGYKLPT